MNEKCGEPCAGLERLQQQVEDLREQNGADHRDIRDRLGKVETENAVQVVQYRTILDKLSELSMKHDHLVGKLEALEAKPGKRWDGLVDKLLFAAAGAVLAWLAAGMPGGL